MSGLASKRWWRVLAVLMALGLLAAACGGDDSDSGGGDGGGEGAEAVEGDPDEGETPQYGGKVTFARESETSSPWTPASMVCDLSCHQAVNTFYDPLTKVNENLEPTPFLLESIEPNEDYTVWTLTARPDITFHDGTPFDAAAIVDHLERMRASFLVGRSLLDVQDQVAVDDMTVEVTMGRPWVTFPLYMAGQPGYIASPTWLAAVDAGEADAAEPVGTGPFTFGSYQSGNNLVVERNPDYWLLDDDGNQYPYLDEIEFQVIEDDQTRERAMTSGEVDMTQTEQGESRLTFREQAEAGDIGYYEMTEQATSTYALINTANTDSPVSDIRIRQAMAHATDQELRNQARSAGVPEIANSPFPPGSTGYLEDNGFPEFDPERARELVEEYKADEGVDTVSIQFDTTADTENKGTVELLQQMLEEVGIEVTIAQFEQGEFINNALQGSFEVFTWRNHSGGSPDTERVWWHSETAEPIGEIALNFGRIDDEVIDENLDVIRESDDPDAVEEAAQNINRRFAEQVYNVWSDWQVWTVPYKNRVHGIRTPIRLPNGDPSATWNNGAYGAIGTMQLWVDDAA
ncbi:MAG: ABC transporter substrate-binding protein [Actinomycetota bacterium]